MSDLQTGGGPPGALPFAYGHVDPALFPIEQLAEAAGEALAQHGQSALNYGAELGCGPLRDYLRSKLARDEGLALEPENLIITAGASGALDMALRLFTRPGDTVLVEAPSYHEALAVIRDYPVKLAAVPMDGDGLRVDALQRRLASLVGAGERPALLYTIPSFQNPSGVTLSAERRLQALELAYRHDLLIIEDDVYRDIYFEDPPPRSIFQMDTHGATIRLGSFSKILAPGLRVGWAVGTAAHVERMAACGLTRSGGGANPFAAYVAAVFCERGWLEPHIVGLRQAYRQRREVLLAALRATMPPDVAWTEPAGGFFVWLTLPEPLSAPEVLQRAQRLGITFLTGEPFFAKGHKEGRRHIRVPFSYLELGDLTRGMEILAEAIRQSA